MSSTPANESARITEEAAQWLEAIERTLNPRESVSLRDWLKVSEHRRTIVERCRLWHGPEVLAVLQELVPIDTFARRVERQYGRIALALFLGISGITFTTVVIAVSKMWSRAEEAWTLQRADADLYTNKTEQRTIELPDGSVLKMSEDTHVLVNYRPQMRELTLLRGEAQVEVAPDTRRELSLHAAMRNLTVGHEAANFKVRRFAEHIELAVLDGQVTALASRGRTAMTPALRRARASSGTQVFTTGEMARLGAGWQLSWNANSEDRNRALEF